VSSAGLGAPDPPASRRRTWIIVAAAVVAVLVGVALVVALGGDDDGDGGIDASPAAKAVRALDDDVDAAGFEDGGTSLGHCPLGDIRDLADLAPRGFDATAAADDDIEATAFDIGRRSDPTIFQCNLTSEDGDTAFGAIANVAPGGDLHRFIERGLPDHTIKFEDDVNHRGGKLISYCASADADGGVDLCETDWVGDGIQLGLYASGDGSDAELTSKWVIAALDTMVANVAELDVDEVVTTTT
jgi:hypothetical protein